MRKLLIGLGVLVVVLLGVAFAGPLFVPTESIKADIAAEVRKATGRTLSINGDLNFRVLPKPGVSVNDVALSNAGQGRETPMVRLDSASVEVALFPLLTGNVQVSRIVLRKPDILLEQYADGTNNWTFTPTDVAAPTSAEGDGASPDAGESSSTTPAVRFDDVVIADGTLTYRTPDQSERVEDIDMSLGAGSLTGPFRAEGSLMARGFDIELTAGIGELVEDKATPINLRIATAGADINYSGVLSGATGTPRVSGQVEMRADDLSAMIASVSKSDAPPALKGKALEIDGTVSASQEAVTVSDLALRLGEDSATGAIDVALGENVSANVVLNMSQLDLDRLLAETGATSSSANGEGSTAPGSRAGGTAGTDESATGFAIPTAVSASLETKIDALVYRDGVIRQVVLNAEMADGVVNISRASAQLPGGSSASLVGLVSTPEAGPEFNGQAELSSDDLRSLMTWAGADVAAVPAERLRKMAGSVSVTATPENITLTDIDVSVDVSRLRGGVAIALRDRPGFGVGLSLDKLNLDAYLPEEATAPGAGGASATAAASDSKPETADTPAGLAVLNDFDAILQIKVGELVFREQNIRGINLDSTLQAGDLQIRDASVANLEGAKLSTTGRVTGLDGSPAADLTIDVDAPNADRLLALAGVSAPAPIGPGKLNGTFKGDLENLAINTSVQALGANLKAVGTVAPLALPPRYDLTLDLKHPDASAFMARLGGDSAAQGVKTGALAAVVAVNGDLNATTLNANIGVGPGKVLLDGDVAGLASGTPTGALSLDVSHPDMAAFVRTFANEYRPALAEPGPFALKARLDMQPDLVTLPNLEGRAGPVSYSGNARLATSGARPDLSAELNTSEIIVDWFLPVPTNRAASGGGAVGASAGGGGSPGSGAARWSREPLDLSALQSADATIKLGAPAITYTNIRVDQPQLALTVKNGVLDLNQLSGQAFGGTFGMTAQVADRDVPTMAYALNVKGADAAKFLGGSSGGGDKGVMSALDLLFPISNVKLVSGTLGADLNVTARGRSEFEMISNLGGTGAVQFTNAVIDGVDVCRISNQLDNLNGLEGFLGLATSAQGGQTKLSSFDGRFDIANGVATLPQQQMSPDCATVSFAGTTNLPQWLIDVQARAAFPAHPEFPGVVVEQKGPLDAPNTRLVNVNQINEFIASKAVGTALRKFLPGATQQQQPAQQGGQSPAPSQEPVDQFKNLLEGLIKRR